MRKLNSFGHCSSEKWAFKMDSRWTGGSKLRKNIWNIRVFITLDNHWSTTVATSSSSSTSMSTGSRSSSSVTSSPTTSRKCTRGTRGVGRITEAGETTGARGTAGAGARATTGGGTREATGTGAASASISISSSLQEKIKLKAFYTLMSIFPTKMQNTCI